MHDATVIWDLDDDPSGNVAHIAEHDLTKDDVLHALNDPGMRTDVSRTSGNAISFGETSDGRYIAVVWELVGEDPLTIYPLTAYEVPRPRSRSKRR
jgi:hypothetical protein